MLLIVEFKLLLFFNSCFLSILSTFLTFSSRTSSLYCLSRNFFLIIAQYLSYYVVAEKIVFSPQAWLYGMLLFRDLGCSDLVCKNSCSSVGFRKNGVWVLLFSSLYSILWKNAIFLGKIWKSNLIVLSFSFNSFMNAINSAFVHFHIIMLSIDLRYSRNIFLTNG